MGVQPVIFLSSCLCVALKSRARSSLQSSCRKLYTDNCIRNENISMTPWGVVQKQDHDNISYNHSLPAQCSHEEACSKGARQRHEEGVCDHCEKGSRQEIKFESFEGLLSPTETASILSSDSKNLGPYGCLQKWEAHFCTPTGLGFRV